MTKKLTISVDPGVYEGLHAVIGRRNISRFLNDLARPHVTEAALDEGYRAKAADEAAERAATDWCDGLISDAYDGDATPSR